MVKSLQKFFISKRNERNSIWWKCLKCLVTESTLAEINGNLHEFQRNQALPIMDPWVSTTQQYPFSGIKAVSFTALLTIITKNRYLKCDLCFLEAQLCCEPHPKHGEQPRCSSEHKEGQCLMAGCQRGHNHHPQNMPRLARGPLLCQKDLEQLLRSEKAPKKHHFRI